MPNIIPVVVKTAILAFSVLIFLVLTAPSTAFAAWNDISSNVTITHTDRAIDRVKGTMFSYVTIENASTQDIAGPLRLVVQDSTIAVTGKSGTTESGSPYAIITEESIPAISKIIYRVDFELSRTALSFTPKLEQEVKTNSIKLLSPQDGQTIDYSYVTFEIDATDMKNVEVKNISLTDSSIKLGIQSKDMFYVYSILLINGENEIEINSTDVNDNVHTKRIILISLGKGLPPVKITVTPRAGNKKLTTEFDIKSLASTSGYLLDSNGDFILDDISVENKFAVEFANEGRYIPNVTVRTDSNILYTSNSRFTDPIDVYPLPTENQEKQDLSSLGVVDDIEESIYWDKLFILSDNIIYIFSFDDTLISKIIPSDVVDLKGIAVDESDNLYLADAGNDKVIRLLKENDYKPDETLSSTGSFGETGIEDGQFDKPIDIFTDGDGEYLRMFVLDNGNKRIQVFDHIGTHLKSFNGEGAKSGKLVNPVALTTHSGAVVVTDAGANLIRTFFQGGGEQDSFGKDILSTPSKTTVMHDGTMLVSDTNNKRIVYFNTVGEIEKIMKIDAEPVNALDFVEQREKIYLTYKNSPGVAVLDKNPDPIGSRPIDIVAKYVDAFKKDDKEYIENIAVNKSVIRAILKDKNSMRTYLDTYNLFSEYKLSGKDSTGAEVIAKMKLPEGEIDYSFQLTKVNGRWMIKEF